MYSSAAAFLGKRPRQHELGLEDGAGRLNHPVKCRRHPPDHRVVHPPLDVFDRLSGISFKPSPIEALGHDPKLDDEVARQVVRLDLTALFLPKMEKRSLVVCP